MPVSRVVGRGARPDSAFSLIELLVVLGLMALIAGLTFGSLFRSREVDRLLATEHLVSDLVRQARHTARTSGGPVVLLIRAEQRDIAGVSRVPLWSEGFEGTRLAGNALGETGAGLTIDNGLGAPPAQSLATFGQQPLRIGGGRRDGFYLACSVLPTPLADILAPDVPAPIPLLMVGTSERPQDSVCGLWLEPEERVMQVLDPAFTQGVMTLPVSPRLRCYDLCGWVACDSGLIDVSALDDTPTDKLHDPLLAYPNGRDEDILHVTAGGERDIAGPLVGGRWVEIGLLFDGTRLTLYRDGQRAGEILPDASTQAITTLRESDAIWIGAADGIVSPYRFTIDNARLYRLTTDQPGRLPQGVSAGADYRIVAHPEGRVEVYQVAPAIPSPLPPLSVGVIDAMGTVSVQLQDQTAPVMVRELANPAPLAFASDRPGVLGGVAVTVASDGRVGSAFATTGTRSDTGGRMLVLKDEP